MSNPITVLDCEFESSTSSASVDLGGRTLVGVQSPSGIGSATTYTIKNSDDNSTFVNSNAYNGEALAVSTYYSIEPALSAGFKYVQLLLDSSESITFKLYVRDAD